MIKQDVENLNGLVNDIKEHISIYLRKNLNHFPEDIDNIDELWQNLRDNFALNDINELGYKLQHSGLTGQQLEFKIRIFKFLKSSEISKDITDFISILLGSLSKVFLRFEAIKEFFDVICLVLKSQTNLMNKK